jgi:hypothetical protein
MAREHHYDQKAQASIDFSLLIGLVCAIIVAQGTSFVAADNEQATPGQNFEFRQPELEISPPMPKGLCQVLAEAVAGKRSASRFSHPPDLAGEQPVACQVRRQ